MVLISTDLKQMRAELIKEKDDLTYEQHQSNSSENDTKIDKVTNDIAELQAKIDKTAKSSVVISARADLDKLTDKVIELTQQKNKLDKPKDNTKLLAVRKELEIIKAQHKTAYKIYWDAYMDRVTERKPDDDDITEIKPKKHQQLYTATVSTDTEDDIPTTTTELTIEELNEMENELASEKEILKDISEIERD